VAAVLASADPCDPQGRDFAVCFDAGRGVELSGYGGLLGPSASSTLSASVRLRGVRNSRSKQGAVWFNDHRLAHFELRPDDKDRALTVTAYEGLLRRHVEEGYLLLPFNPPKKLPFPLDLGIAFSVARWERAVANGWAFETARVTLFFDAVRAPTARFHLGLGPSLAHTMRGGLGAPLTHELMPLTGLQALATLESEEGRWLLRAQGVAGWTFEPGRSDGTFRARGEVVGERVVFAINDQPVAVTLRATAAFRDVGGGALSEWTVQAGLTLRLFSAQ
jgi:hypothetical protein